MYVAPDLFTPKLRWARINGFTDQVVLSGLRAAFRTVRPARSSKPGGSPEVR